MLLRDILEDNWKAVLGVAALAGFTALVIHTRINRRDFEGRIDDCIVERHEVYRGGASIAGEGYELPEFVHERTQMTCKKDGYAEMTIYHDRKPIGSLDDVLVLRGLRIVDDQKVLAEKRAYFKTLSKKIDQANAAKPWYKRVFE